MAHTSSLFNATDAVQTNDDYLWTCWFSSSKGSALSTNTVSTVSVCKTLATVSVVASLIIVSLCSPTEAKMREDSQTSQSDCHVGAAYLLLTFGFFSQIFYFCSQLFKSFVWFLQLCWNHKVKQYEEATLRDSITFELFFALFFFLFNFFLECFFDLFNDRQ